MNVVVLRRRLFYICAMVALVVPLYFLGNPSVRNGDGTIKVAGGALAQIRAEYDLGQGDLGEIDPASESMRLATLGLRGVAATILWQKAEFYKREQYWDRLSATLNQIAVLQPHFIEIWKFQSHNLSYNVSTQFDNYKHRYDWVKKGMNYLVRGSKINKKRTEMPFQLGWFFGNKFGVADEKIQFRDLYRNDTNFHEQIEEKTELDVTTAEGRGPDGKPDNWLTGRLWYERAYAMVDQGSRPAKSTMMFYREGPQWLMKYSEAIQKDGFLDDAARFAWRSAGGDWRKFGERSIVTTWGDTIYLTEVELANEEYKTATDTFIEYCGDTYQNMADERDKALTDEERAAMDLPVEERSLDQMIASEQAMTKIALKPQDVARQLPSDKRVDGMQMAKNLNALRDKIQHIEIYRNQVNYAYWEQRCVAEQEEAALAARTNMFKADQLVEDGLLDEALEKYEFAFENWSVLFNEHPAMMIDDAAEDVANAVERYRRLLDVPLLPEDFALKKFLQFREAYEDQFADPAMMSVIASWPRKYPDRNFLDEMIKKSEDFQRTLAEQEAERQRLEEESKKAKSESDGDVDEAADQSKPAEEDSDERANVTEEAVDTASGSSEDAEAIQDADAKTDEAKTGSESSSVETSGGEEKAKEEASAKKDSEA